VSDAVAALAAVIAGVALYGVNDAILYSFHNAYMAGNIVLRPGGTFVVPVKKYDVS